MKLSMVKLVQIDYSSFEVAVQGFPRQKGRRLGHIDPGGAFGLIPYKRLRQMGRASGTLFLLPDKIANGEAGTGFPDVLYIQDILAFPSGGPSHVVLRVLHAVGLNQFDLVLYAILRHHIRFNLSSQNISRDWEVFPRHTDIIL